MKSLHCLRMKNNLILFFILASLYSLHLVEARREMLIDVSSPSSNDDHNVKGSKLTVSTSMALMLILLALVFAIIGWIIIYYRQIPGTSFYDASSGGEFGLDQNIINTFPTLLYSEVKKLKIGKEAILECAVCLDEFREEGEMLRLLPKCYHLYHRKCIDEWFVDHTTCPVCRANLVPNSNELMKELLHLQESDLLSSCCDETRAAVPDVKISLQRSNTTGYSVFHVGEYCERFTLRLTDEVRRQLLVDEPTLQRTVSLAAWPRLPSSPQGYKSEGRGNSLLSTGIRGDGKHSDVENVV